MPYFCCRIHAQANYRHITCYRLCGADFQQVAAVYELLCQSCGLCREMHQQVAPDDALQRQMPDDEKNAGRGEKRERRHRT